MRYAFVLHHVHELENDADDTKFIGVYSSEENAKAAIERLKNQPGFAGSPEGFDISKYELDKDHWSEGYVTYRY